MVDYTLRTGESAAARLSLLERVYGPDCNRILLDHGVAAGLQAADIGCGTGSTTLWLASEIGPTVTPTTSFTAAFC